MKNYDVTYKTLGPNADPTDDDLRICAAASTAALRQRFPGCAPVEVERGMVEQPRRAAYVRMEVRG